ncbi:hypothetical protein HPB51_016937 [Rhipicephalus microplus]|uniref:Uncharacterized protein n=1 Tax=Rhipicephalus microplus TaxID=6941 RepID=A0A9J6F4P5_RHIMP|nr:hypothetical protein HPB51_016937 [Rhipicephalus microplus]
METMTRNEFRWLAFVSHGTLAFRRMICGALIAQVLCQEAGYRELPSPVPRAAVALLLTSNQLERLATDSFLGLVRLRKLILDNNRIQALAPFTFRGLSGLDELSLQNNPLTVLSQQPDAFAGLRNVSLVSIEAPRLKRLPQFAFRGLEHAGELLIRDAEIGLIDSGAFAGLSHVRRVTLEGSTVEAVRAAAFAGMRAVGQLRIGGNRLGSVLPGALDALDQASVSHVLLSGNWLPCDCRLRWAPESLRRRGFCSSPAHLLNASAAQVALDTLPRCLPEHFVPHTRPDAPPLSGRQQTSGAATHRILAAHMTAVAPLLLLASGAWLQHLVFETSCLPDWYL